MTEPTSHERAALAAIQAAFTAKYPSALFHDTTGECVAQHAHAWREFKDGWMACNTFTIHGISYDAPNVERVITELREENANVTDQHELGAQRLQDVERQLAEALEALAAAKHKERLADNSRNAVLKRWASVPSSIPSAIVEKLGHVVEREFAAETTVNKCRRILREVLITTAAALERQADAEEVAARLEEVPQRLLGGADEERLILPLCRPWNVSVGGEGG